MSEYSDLFKSIIKMAEDARELNRELVKAGIEDTDALIQEIKKQTEDREKKGGDQHEEEKL